jgi:hypothetical protein
MVITQTQLADLKTFLKSAQYTKYAVIAKIDDSIVMAIDEVVVPICGIYKFVTVNDTDLDALDQSIYLNLKKLFKLVSMANEEIEIIFEPTQIQLELRGATVSLPLENVEYEDEADMAAIEKAYSQMKNGLSPTLSLFANHLEDFNTLLAHKNKGSYDIMGFRNNKILYGGATSLAIYDCKHTIRDNSVTKWFLDDIISLLTTVKNTDLAVKGFDTNEDLVISNGQIAYITPWLDNSFVEVEGYLNDSIPQWVSTYEKPEQIEKIKIDTNIIIVPVMDNMIGVPVELRLIGDDLDKIVVSTMTQNNNVSEFEIPTNLKVENELTSEDLIVQIPISYWGKVIKYINTDSSLLLKNYDNFFVMENRGVKNIITKFVS